MATPNGETRAALLAEVAADDWGQVTVGLYDTARLVAIAPWLSGHRARVEFLCQRQQTGGQWGGPAGYELVPTLSATAALLTELRRTGPHDPRLARAAAGGLRALRPWLGGDGGRAVPDTIGVELIVPALVEELAELVNRSGPVAGQVATAEWLRLPPGFDARLLARARARFAAGELPQRAWACLEIFGPAAVAAPAVRPAGGAVGCSAAATAAWLGGASGHQEALEFLAGLQARGGGPVPGVTPISYFEPAWVLNSLAIAGPAPVPPAALLDRLVAGLGDGGAPAAPGLPPDSDDTAAVLAALLRYGRARSPDVLLEFRADDHFRCFHGERNPSVSANAHVLEALALHLRCRPEQRSRFAAPAAMAARWLVDQQLPDGAWQDKWHASPYYASFCCALALRLHGPAAAQPALDRVVAWVRATQRADGSWGRWQPTIEETSYAVQLLLEAAPQQAAEAIARGRRYLAGSPPLAEQLPLWHAKDLYTPVAVVRAARLAALGPGDPAATRGAAGTAPAGASAAIPAQRAVPTIVSRSAGGGTG